MTEREQGRRAAAAGIAQGQNPYRPGTRGHFAWDAGWVLATFDASVDAEMANRRAARRELAEAFDELGRTLLASPPGRLLEAIVARLDLVVRRVVG